MGGGELLTISCAPPIHALRPDPGPARSPADESTTLRFGLIPFSCTVLYRHHPAHAPPTFVQYAVDSGSSLRPRLLRDDPIEQRQVLSVGAAYIVRQMLRKVTVVDHADTTLLPGELVDFKRYQQINREAVAEGKRHELRAGVDLAAEGLLAPPAPRRYVCTPCPRNDYNGAGFLYFANFAAVLDRAAWEWWHEAPAATTAETKLLRRSFAPRARSSAVLALSLPACTSTRATPERADWGDSTIVSAAIGWMFPLDQPQNHHRSPWACKPKRRLRVHSFMARPRNWSG